MTTFFFVLRDHTQTTIIIFNLRTAAFKIYCAIWVRSSNFRHQALYACHHARAPSGGRWNCGR